MTDIYVCGVGMTPFGRHLEKNMKQLTREAVSAALADAGCEVDDIQAAWFASATTGCLQGQHSIPGQIALRSMGFQGIPVFNLENACASGSSAFNQGVIALLSGEQDAVLAIGAEKMYIEDKIRMLGIFDSGWDIEAVEENKERLLALGAGVEVPEGSTSPGPYSVFMDVYAAICRQHMRKFGTTQRQIAAVSAKNHQHSVHNPNAQYQKPFTIEEVLASPPITYPLTLPMCSPVSDGAAAAIICSKDGMARLGIDKSRAVKVLASVVQTGSDRDPEDHEQHLTAIAARKLYERAGVGPEEVNVAEVHDASAMGEIIQAENLQLVGFGEAGPAALRGDFSIGGRLPINPSGGLESRGHPVGATGLAQIHELATQLRGEAGARQVDGARIAVQENGGGLYGCEEAVAVLNLFGRP